MFGVFCCISLKSSKNKASRYLIAAHSSQANLEITIQNAYINKKRPRPEYVLTITFLHQEMQFAVVLSYLIKAAVHSAYTEWAEPSDEFFATRLVSLLHTVSVQTNTYFCYYLIGKRKKAEIRRIQAAYSNC